MVAVKDHLLPDGCSNLQWRWRDRGFFFYWHPKQTSDTILTTAIASQLYRLGRHPKSTDYFMCYWMIFIYLTFAYAPSWLIQLQNESQKRFWDLWKWWEKWLKMKFLLYILHLHLFVLNNHILASNINVLFYWCYVTDFRIITCCPKAKLQMHH